MSNDFYVQIAAQNALICCVGTHAVDGPMSLVFLVLSVFFAFMMLKREKQND